VNAHIQERYTRSSRNDLKVTITVDDPKVYTKPFSLGPVGFRWIPNQQLDEWQCIPSEVQEYLQTMAILPAVTRLPMNRGGDSSSAGIAG